MNRYVPANSVVEQQQCLGRCNPLCKLQFMREDSANMCSAVVSYVSSRGMVVKIREAARIDQMAASKKVEASTYSNR